MEFGSFSVESTVEVSMRGGVTRCSPALVSAAVFLGVEDRGAVDVLGREVEVVACESRASVLRNTFVRGSGHSELGEKTAIRFDIFIVFIVNTEARFTDEIYQVTE